MTKIQIDLSEKENLAVELYKITHGLRTKEETIKSMIQKSKKMVRKEVKEMK